jgi:hypothetical protein
VKVSDEMWQTFLGVLESANPQAHSGGVMRAALEAALAPFEAPPFVLSEDEKYAFRAIFEHCEEGHYVYIQTAQTALDRACKTLGVAQAAPVGDLLTAKERAILERVRPLHESNPDMLSPADIDPIFDMLDRIAPKLPTAAVRSPGQVAFETHLKAGDWEGLSDFVRSNWELTAAAVLANAAKVTP